ncbi:MAG: serine/threonine-protein kinase [Sandaracinaceae bacterium]
MKGRREATDPASEGAPRALVGGRYRLLDRLGRGGMAEVWDAHDVRLARRVAVKLLTLQADDERDLAQLFLREARLVAALHHPNVVAILDFGTDEGERPYLVMERLEGESLESRLAHEGSLELAELIAVALEVLSGLEAVHRAGIVHRDLKPANLFLLRHREGARVKLIDFGVSRANPMEGRRSVLTTMRGRLVGTPAYMAPEQARGLPDIDHRADLYGLGAILYECLTGRLPYQAEAPGDLIIAIAAGGAPTVASLRPEAGEAISRLVECAMAVPREDRFQSATEMRDALLEVTATLGVDIRASLPTPPVAPHGWRGPTLETLDRHTTPAEGPVASLPPQQGRTRVLGIGLALGAVALAGLVAGVVSVLGDPAAPAAPAEPAAPSAAPPVAGPAAPEPPPPRPAARVESPEVAPPTDARITLEGLPPDARVLVDGTATTPEGDVVEVPRDRAPHVIEVRAAQGRWRHELTAEADTSLRVRFPRARPPVPDDRPARPQVFREPDF